MKNEIKILLGYSKTLFKAAFILWAVETTIFLIIEGWHLKATNPIEVFLDDCVTLLFKVGFFTAIYCAWYYVFFKKDLL